MFVEFNSTSQMSKKRHEKGPPAPLCVDLYSVPSALAPEEAKVYHKSMALPRYIPHYKVEDYRTWEGDWELWSGEAISMSPSAKRRHQAVCGELHYRIKKALEASGCQNCAVYYELDWIVSEDTVLRPDLLLVCGESTGDFIQETPSLVVEVLSDSTRHRDLVYKKEMYEQLGVLFYLIVDPDDGQWQALVNSDSGFEAMESPEFQVHADCRFYLELERLV